VEPSDVTTTTNGDDRPEAFSSGSERGYWKRLETVEVGLLAEREGWFLQKYKVESDVSDCGDLFTGYWADGQKRGAGAVSRRYSDFVWLLDCLIKRYVRIWPKEDGRRLTPSHSVYFQLYRPRRLVVSPAQTGHWRKADLKPTHISWNNAGKLYSDSST
jgi:hypothetical protein